MPPIHNAVWLDQNWTTEQRDWFHHPDQGTQTFGIPYEWFMALEQPALSLTAPALLSDPQYLDRYGFIPSGARFPQTGTTHRLCPRRSIGQHPRRPMAESADECGDDRLRTDVRRMSYGPLCV